MRTVCGQWRLIFTDCTIGRYSIRSRAPSVPGLNMLSPSSAASSTTRAGSTVVAPTTCTRCTRRTGDTYSAIPPATTPMRPALMTSLRQRARRRRRAVFSSSKTSPWMARGRAAEGLRARVLEATALLLVALQRQLDEAGDQVAVGEARVLPELGVHAHRREAGDGVQLVEEDAAVRRQEEVDARQAGAVDRLVRLQRPPPDALPGCSRDIGRDAQVGSRSIV